MARNNVEDRSYSQEIGTDPATLSIAKHVVQLCWHDGHVPLLIGESGTGKTAAINQLGELNDMRVIPFHLGNADSNDIRGPMFPQAGGTFKFLTPNDIPVKWTPSLRQERILHRAEQQGLELDDLLDEDFREDQLTGFSEKDYDVVFSIRRDARKEKAKAALLFDEVNRTGKNTLNAVMSTWTENRLGDAEIGPNVRIVGAMNPPGGSYAVNSQFSQDPAMRRRLCQIVVNFSHSEFMRYAKDPEKVVNKSVIPPVDFEELQNRNPYRPYHPAVISFLRQNPKYALDIKAKEANKVYGCPPTWEAVSDTMYTVERLELDMDHSIIRNVVRTKLSGHVGSAFASEFIDHYEKTTDVIEPLELLFEYKEGTPVYAKVQRKLNSGEHLGMQKIVADMVEYIFDPEDEDFSYEEIAPQLAKLLNDLPPNTAQKVMKKFTEVSKDLDKNVTEEVVELALILSEQKDFQEYQQRQADTQNEMAEQRADAEQEMS